MQQYRKFHKRNGIPMVLVITRTYFAATNSIHRYILNYATLYYFAKSI
jgi:hypothetical protein